MTFDQQITTWYYQNKRSLPWRESSNSFHIWLSEVIMQQTRIAQGTSYYLKFIQSYPTVKSLANAPLDDVMKLWEGLGYYSRARNLHTGAKQVVQDFNGELPNNYNDLIKIKGIGPYTAAAIASICFNEKRAVVDGNVYRVLARNFGISIPINAHAGKKHFEEFANHLISKSEIPGDYNQGLMEFGALHCTPAKPGCQSCIFQQNCVAYNTGQVVNLPVKIKKKPLKNRYLNYIVHLNDNHVLVEKRQTKDIWTGLYQFPLHETENSLHSLDGATKLDGEIKHILSHQRLHITFWLKQGDLNAGEGFTKVHLKDINKLAFPIVIKRFVTSKLLPLAHRLA